MWTKKANFERKEILEYWINRNKSKTYSSKLNILIIETLVQLSENPSVGRKSDFENIHVKIIHSYLLFYEFDSENLKVLSIWDGRRDQPNPLK